MGISPPNEKYYEGQMANKNHGTKRMNDEENNTTLRDSSKRIRGKTINDNRKYRLDGSY